MAEFCDNKLKQLLSAWTQQAVQKAQGSAPAPLAANVVKYCNFVWELLATKGAEALAALSASSARSAEEATVKELVEEAVRFCVPLAHKEIQPLPSTAGPSRPLEKPLSIGSCNCGKTGLIELNGHALRWSLLTGQHGFITTMLQRELHVLVLPGARLPASFRAPREWDVSCCCRGGPSFASVSVFWRKKADLPIRVVEDLGNDRCIWLEIGASTTPSHFFLAGVYLPACNGTSQRDEDWKGCVDKVAKDLEELKRRVPSAEFMIIGDVNVQPIELSPGLPTTSQRQRIWTKLLSTTRLTSLNPLIGSAESLELPTRRTVVPTSFGATFHGCTPAKALDITLVSGNLNASLVIHNGVHCRETCKHMSCTEVGLSDHFLLEVVILGATVTSQTTATPSFPQNWHDKGTWRTALHSAEPLLLELAQSLTKFITHRLQNDVVKSRIQVEFDQALLEAGAWLQCFIGNFARARFVQTRFSKTCAPRVEFIDQSPPPPGSICGLALDGPLVEAHLRRCLQHSELSRSILKQCYACLRPTNHRPESRMRHKGAWCDERATHSAWVQRLQDQCSTAEAGEARLDCARSLGVILGRAKADALRHPGRAEDISELVTNLVVEDWDASAAMPPDLLPRALFKARILGWDLLCWCLVRLAGPRIAAARPWLWRLASLAPLWKKGDCLDTASYRLIFVKSQMGLLQEGVLMHELRPTIQAAVSDNQSGYVRDCGDPVLSLHLIFQMRAALSLPWWICLGDFQSAFPKVWREDLLCLLNKQAGLSGASLCLLASMFQLDVVIVGLGGPSAVEIRSGLPEGGVLGPATYTSLPESLTRLLEDNGLGIGLDPKIPEVWQGFIWTGGGNPDPSMIDTLHLRLTDGGRLPRRSQLANDPNLEASALAALDRSCSRRLVALLHADDPVFVASSAGQLQTCMNLVASWSLNHGARFHLGAEKTVTMNNVGGKAQVVNFCYPSSTPTLLLSVTLKKWLGCLLSFDASVSDTLRERLGAAEVAFSRMCGLVACGALPLAHAAALFAAKVDGVLASYRWLWAVAPDCESIVNSRYHRWALALFGSEPWRNATIAELELGWSLTGFARAVEAVALRRAKLLLLQKADLHAFLFTIASTVEGTWAHKSKLLLGAWSLEDLDVGTEPMASYKLKVRRALEARCSDLRAADVARHVFPFPYSNLQLGPSSHLASLLGTAASWSQLVGVRSWCRLRLGIPRLCAVSGKKSAAKSQSCLFCPATVCPTSYDHAFCVCPHFASLRCSSHLFAAAADALSLPPGHPLFCSVLAMARSIDSAADCFWRGRRLACAAASVLSVLVTGVLCSFPLLFACLLFPLPSLVRLGGSTLRWRRTLGLVPFFCVLLLFLRVLLLLLGVCGFALRSTQTKGDKKKQGTKKKSSSGGPCHSGRKGVLTSSWDTSSGVLGRALLPSKSSAALGLRLLGAPASPSSQRRSTRERGLTSWAAWTASVPTVRRFPALSRSRSGRAAWTRNRGG